MYATPKFIRDEETGDLYKFESDHNGDTIVSKKHTTAEGLEEWQHIYFLRYITEPLRPVLNHDVQTGPVENELWITNQPTRGGL